MTWTTPLKLPVVQPYRSAKGQRVHTNLQDIFLTEPTVADAVNKRKQLQAFPPNFIHSLDATHMVLSALKCDELGLTFTAVHDSFWTHAADVDTLNTVLREAFIRMHSEDIVRRLAAEFKLRYKGHVYLAAVRSSTPLAKKLREYRKAHNPQSGRSQAQSQYDELLREIKKQNLMQSPDPAERDVGREMVTASTLFLEHDGERALSTKDSLGETAIGAVPKATSEATIAQALRSGDAADDVGKPPTLEPLMPQFSAIDHGIDNLDQDSLPETVLPPDQAPNVKPTTTRQSPYKTTWLWLPLTFRDVPKKGAFDVTRLRESQYFFS